jgi:methionine-rich copper-binding protein CopC
VKPAPTPVDNTPPAVAGLTPANGATNVAVSTNSLEITFDENINKGTGNITISGTGFSQTVDVTTNAVKVNGKKATIDLAQTLPFATAISVTVPQGAFEDQAGNDFAALPLRPGRLPLPTLLLRRQHGSVVSGLSPADEATGVAENTKLEITFSEEVRAGNGNITITVNGTPQTVDVTTNAVKINKEKVTIDAANFPQGATVSILVPAGSFGDLAGNDFAGLAAGGWNFTVKPAPTPTDNTPPAVAGLSPGQRGHQCCRRYLQLGDHFDENINKGTGNITLAAQVLPKR